MYGKLVHHFAKNASAFPRKRCFMLLTSIGMFTCLAISPFVAGAAAIATTRTCGTSSNSAVLADISIGTHGAGSS
jgi:hypothetical protein